MGDKGNDPNRALSRIGRRPGILLKSRYSRRSFMLTGRRLALKLAFTVLVALAFGAGCRGFFPKNTLSSIAIQPPSPQIEVGPTTSQTLQAWGTYQDNTRRQITSGVVWTSSDTTVVSIVANTRVATGEKSGTATITASAQGLSATATATAFLANITGFQVCMGTFGATTSCSSGSTPLTWNPNATITVNQSFIAQGTSNGTGFDLTTASTWTVAPTPVAGSLTCSNSGVSPETCTVNAGTTAGTYTITVTYGTSSTATVNVTVTN